MMSHPADNRTPLTFMVRTAEEKRNLIRSIETIVPDKDKPKTVTITNYKSNRTLQQNRMFHGIIRNMARYLGYGAEEMKQVVVTKFLGTYESTDPETDEKIRYTPSTSELSPDEMDDLIVQTQYLASELEVPMEKLHEVA